ncbi:MAG: serine/threonine-protein kinase [Taibaiella sp.]|nr:serine/threonine-protein kinase [Taibaiella sp.]
MHTLSELKSGALAGARSLKISEELTDFPVEIFELTDTLEVLDLSGNLLTSLPHDLGRLKKLKIVFCSNNPFTELPEVLGECPELDVAGFKACKIENVPPAALNPNLRWLILTDNRISELPDAIGQCTRLQKLMLAGNRLESLPESLQYCQNLQLLRISANRLAELPSWLCSMPRLAWLAFSGNDFSHIEPVTDLPYVQWDDLEMVDVIGEGASGQIYRAHLRGLTSHATVAVKVYKGSVTSDGFPEDEMTAAIAAGEHEGLVRLVGRIAGHPQDRHGLVMELIPQGFSNLGGPPSMQSCTRDVFRTGQKLPLSSALKVACTIASVGKHLHERRIMHGDLYAHNTLVDESGNTLISDFGAASFYTNLPSDMAAGLERIEISAFGYLLDDLLRLCTDATGKEAYLQMLQLRDRCLQADVLSRPDFTLLSEALACLE